MKKEIIKDIRDRLQFLITVEILLAAMFYEFFKVQNATEVVANTQSLAWYIGIAAAVFIYLLVGIDAVFNEYFLKFVRFLMSLTLTTAGIIIFLFALVEYKPLPGTYWGFIFYVTLNATLWLPVITFALTVIACYWGMISDIAKWTIELIRKKKQ